MRTLVLAAAIFSLILPWQSLAASSLASQLAGRIVLDVEAHGEAWYINPVTLQRTFLGRPEDALTIMRSYGLGITRDDLERIPEIGSFSTGDVSLRQRLAGRILLQVQEHGEAWYVEPVSQRRIYLGRPADAFRIMSSYGLGINTNNLAEIPMAQPGNATTQTSVPFVMQAPLGDWSDPRQQDGCEEASALMAVAWARGESLEAAQAKTAIVAMSDWEQNEYGYYQDTGLIDTVNRLVDEYLGFTNYEINANANTDDLLQALQAGSIVILPINGQVFEPFYYTPPGPARHMIVVHGYDAATDTFTAHDPGTVRGANLQVTRASLETSWRDYASGEQVAIPSLPNSMVIIKK